MLNQQQIKYTSREEVPEIFADGIKNVHFTNGVVHAELTVTRVRESAGSPPKPPTLEQVTAQRAVWTPNMVAQLMQTLNALQAVIQQSGALANPLVPPQVPPAPSKAN